MHCISLLLGLRVDRLKDVALEIFILPLKRHFKCCGEFKIAELRL
jgi:hypothetical protein